MAENPYFIAPANPLQALMLGQQGYDRGRKSVNEQAMTAARQEAQNALISGGDTRSALAKLIGAGDIQGANALANFGNQSFDQNYKTQMLDIYKQKAGKEDLPSGFRRSANGLEPIPGGPSDPEYLRRKGDRQNAPAGYMWNDPTNPSAGLTAIPGGPGEKIAAETAARIGLGNSFLGQLPDIQKSVDEGEATGPIDYVTGKIGWGRSGEVHRQIASGAEALLRNLTGAGMNQTEASEYVNRYRPSIRDDAATLKSKLTQLERELKSVMQVVGRGRGGVVPVGAPSGGSPQAPAQAVRVSSPQERDALPPGTQYMAPDGSIRTKQ